MKKTVTGLFGGKGTFRGALKRALVVLGLLIASQHAMGLDSAEGQPPLLRLDPQGHSATVNAVVFSPDGKELISCSDDQTICVWDVATGVRKRVIRASLDRTGPGKVFALAIDPTGRWLACGGELLNNVVRIFDYQSGQLIRTLKDHEFPIAILRFSPDGRWLVSGDHRLHFSDQETHAWGETRLWDTQDWSMKFSSIEAGPVYGLAFSPDGRYYATGADTTILVRETISHRPIAMKRRAHSEPITCLDWSPDGQKIVSSSFDGSVRLWEGPSLDFLGTAIHRTSGTTSLEVVTFVNNTTLACGGSHARIHEGKSANPIILLDFSTGNQRFFWSHDNTIQALTMSPDGRTLASTGGDNTEILVWDQETLAVDHRLLGTGHTVWSLAWQSDSRGIAYGWENGPLTDGRRLQGVFRLDTRTTSDRLSGSGVTNQGIHSFQGQVLEVAPENPQTLKVGAREFSIPLEKIRCFSYTPDGLGIVVGTDEGLYLVRTSDLRVVKEFVGHEDTIWSVSVSPDGKTIASGSSDQTIRFWNLDTSTIDRPRYLGADGKPESIAVKPLLSLFIGSDTEWIAWTPEGYYDSSLNGSQYAGWHFNRQEDQTAEFYSLEQYASVFYRPDVIERALAREKLPLPVNINFDNRPPLISDFKINGKVVYEDQTLMEVDQPEFTIEFSSSGTTVLRQPELFYNGRVISQGKFKGPPQVRLGDDKRSLTASYTFSVNAKENWYRIYTVDERGFKSAAKIVHLRYTGPDATPSFHRLGEKVAKPKTGGTLYVLAIGINEYTNPEMAAQGMGNLTYAEKDASDMVNLWVGQQGQLFEQVETALITKKKLGRPVTKADILTAFTVLGKKATHETDSILVFLSGHGLRKEDGFFFLSSEADPTSKQSLMETSPSWVSIGDRLKAFTRVKEIAVLVDACHSGAINPTELGFTWKDKGVVLMTSSKAGQKSFEGGTYVDERKQKSVFENGLFSLAIIEGLSHHKGPKETKKTFAPADSSQDNVLIVGEILNYAIQQVGLWTNGQQSPWVPAYDPTIEGKILGVVP